MQTKKWNTLSLSPWYTLYLVTAWYSMKNNFWHTVSYCPRQRPTHPRNEKQSLTEESRNIFKAMERNSEATNSLTLNCVIQALILFLNTNSLKDMQQTLKQRYLYLLVNLFLAWYFYLPGFQTLQFHVEVRVYPDTWRPSKQKWSKPQPRLKIEPVCYHPIEKTT